MLAYARPESELTLAEGLAEYHASRADLFRGRGGSEAACEFFRCHDAAHVVFGCDTSLIGEAAVKTWSLFGTTRGLALLRDYRLPEAQEIYERIGWSAVGRTAARATVVLPRVMARCVRMRMRWPWAGFEAHLETPLGALRGEYGIHVLVLATCWSSSRG